VRSGTCDAPTKVRGLVCQEFSRKVVAVGHYNGFWNETDDWVGENPFVSQIRCSVIGAKQIFRKFAEYAKVQIG